MHPAVKHRWRTFGVPLALIVLLPLVSWSDSQVSVSPDRLLQFLNLTIGLDRQVTIQQQIATEPQEQVLLYDNRQIADQIVRYAFDFARAQADSASAQSASAPVANAAAGGSPYAALRRMLANLIKEVQDTQAEQDSDRKKLATAAGAKRAWLQSQISELQGEIALAEARRDAVRNMLDFVSGSEKNSTGAAGLRAQIEALAASVPAANAPASGPARNVTAPVAPAGSEIAPSGIWNLTSDLFSLSSKIQTVNGMMDATNALLRTADELRAPFIAQMRALSKNGDELAAQADTANPAQLAQEKQRLDALAAQFRQISAAVIPLGKQRVLLNLYLKNLVSWRDTIAARYNSDLRGLAIRLALLALIVVFLVTLSELWRRAVYRYVHEPRRRHQYLLLRKLTLWFIIVLLVAFTLAGRLGSFVTFAGLLTAGVAVALQNVIVSIVGYFFLIGKFGIRVGDRVEVNNIAGEVVDIGLVRFHLMELGEGATPTGRVVAFSNSVVFQPAAGLFKQIPGASFAWRHVTLPVPGNVDFASIKESVLAAVETVLREDRIEIERFYSEMEKRGIMISERSLRPKLELHLTPGGMEATIRYPVNLHRATDIDARVSRALRAALERESASPAGEPAEAPLKKGATVRGAD
jgi:small-conductance mechanosensitive channel/antitoxin component of MazEF toxin-antitoxin module